MTDRTFRSDEEKKSNVPEHVREMMEGHEDIKLSPFPTQDLVRGKVGKTLGPLHKEPESEQSE